MEPIELYGAFVSISGNKVTMLFRKPLANTKASSRRIMNYLIAEGFLESGNYMIEVGVPV